MRAGIAALFALFASAALAAEAPVAPTRPVEDVYFGERVVDPYRWMEGGHDEELKSWLAGQNAATRAALDAPGVQRERWLERIRELQSGIESVRFIAQAGDRYVFLQTPADGKDARLMSCDLDGGDRRVLLEPAAVSAGGKRGSIDFLSASPNGRYVSVAVSHGGSEDWVFRIVETTSGKLLDDRVTRISNPFPHWAPDDRGFYYSRLQPEGAAKSELQTYDNIRVHFHAIGTKDADDRAVFGPGVKGAVELAASGGFVDGEMSSDGRWEIMSDVRGVRYGAKAIWLRDLKAAQSAWRKVTDYDDVVGTLLVRDGRAYAIASGRVKDGQVLSFDAATETLADAKPVLDERGLLVSADLGWLAEARDALYVAGSKDGLGAIRRVDWKSGAVGTVALPIEGAVAGLVASANHDGIGLTVDSPVVSPRLYRYDPETKRVTDTGVRKPDPADYANIEMVRVEIESTGGVRVPVTIVKRRDLQLDGTNPTLLATYGAYGAISPIWFIAPNLAWYERGGIFAFAHVRGGGEKGEAWHEAARTVKKQATIDDVVAAAEWLIANRYTSPGKLAIAGKSAGGIPAGGAITQRPELFRAALLRVAVTDLLRIETTAGGPANSLEYGSVKKEPEYRVLRKISPYANVREKAEYPAVLLETGVNDPRVPPWQLAKMAARLQAAQSAKDRPILLRVDYDAGHGVGTDKQQAAALLADEYAFLAWQLGMEPRDADQKR